MLTKRLILAISALFLVVAGCGGEEEFGANPFLDEQGNQGKQDTQYMNPDGIEVEVDLEGDVDAPDFRKGDAPAVLGQFALTYLRKRGEFYLESLAEDATSKTRVEWRVDGNWISAEEAKTVSGDKLTHFRIRGVNAVLLHSASTGATEGKQYLAKVPKRPFSIMTDAGDKCADPDDHMTLSQSIYWYMWNPKKSGCPADLSQDMLITVSKVLPNEKVTYPEYDQLVADGKITVVVLFGLIGDDMKETDIGFRGLKEMARWLEEDDFQEVTAPVGRRFSKLVANVTYEIDLYSPKEFSGLSDYAHKGNFAKAIKEHEVVVYDGHSMLGASDFWATVEYPDFYQIFLYGGCLGYEYYIAPILKSKNGWDKLDLVSSVVEVSVGANEFAGPFLAKLEWALTHNYNVSWRDMLLAIRKRVGDSTFGASGVRDNCFSPAGSLCVPEQPTDDPDAALLRFENTQAQSIPDNDASGIASQIEVTESGIAASVTLELDISHTYPGDLRIVLSHAGKDATIWDNAGGEGTGIQQSMLVLPFEGTEMSGTWELKIVDTWDQDAGTLNSWSVSFTRQ